MASETLAIRFIEPIASIVGDNEREFLDILAMIMIIVSPIVTALQLSGIRTPYGRYATGKFGWGIEVRTAWFIQELPAFLIPALRLYFKQGQYISTFPNLFLVGMFTVHYFQRTFIFSLLIRGGKKTPFVPFILALIFCCYNGFMQSVVLTHYAKYDASWMKDPRFIIGAVMFFSGMFINIQADTILRNLRKPGETGYKIPKGGMFNYVSGANFFGEMLEWTGFAIACWTLQGLAFATFTVCTIGPRALHHHKYYINKFEDYPKSRKAVIPFIL